VETAEAFFPYRLQVMGAYGLYDCIWSQPIAACNPQQGAIAVMLHWRCAPHLVLGLSPCCKSCRCQRWCNSLSCVLLAHQTS